MDNYDKLKEKLISIRGVGQWTADYTILKNSYLNEAFPISEVGIHNAVKGMLQHETKITIDEIRKLAINWSGWQAYVTFYLWRFLYD